MLQSSRININGHVCVMLCRPGVLEHALCGERGALDVVLTDVNVEEFFKQVVVINRAHHHTTVLSSHRSDLGGWRTS